MKIAICARGKGTCVCVQDVGGWVGGGAGRKQMGYSLSISHARIYPRARAPIRARAHHASRCCGRARGGRTVGTEDGDRTIVARHGAPRRFWLPRRCCAPPRRAGVAGAHATRTARARSKHVPRKSARKNVHITAACRHSTRAGTEQASAPAVGRGDGRAAAVVGRSGRAAARVKGPGREGCGQSVHGRTSGPRCLTLRRRSSSARGRSTRTPRGTRSPSPASSSRPMGPSSRQSQVRAHARVRARAHVSRRSRPPIARARALMRARLRHSRQDVQDMGPTHRQAARDA